jgi:hypothetical protein
MSSSSSDKPRFSVLTAPVRRLGWHWPGSAPKQPDNLQQVLSEPAASASTAAAPEVESEIISAFQLQQLQLPTGLELASQRAVTGGRGALWLSAFALSSLIGVGAWFGTAGSSSSATQAAALDTTALHTTALHATALHATATPAAALIEATVNQTPTPSAAQAVPAEHTVPMASAAGSATSMARDPDGMATRAHNLPAQTADAVPAPNHRAFAVTATATPTPPATPTVTSVRSTTSALEPVADSTPAVEPSLKGSTPSVEPPITATPDGPATEPERRIPPLAPSHGPSVGGEPRVYRMRTSEHSAPALEAP